MGRVEAAMSWNSCWQLHGGLQAISNWRETWENSLWGLGALKATLELVTLGACRGLGRDVRCRSCLSAGCRRCLSAGPRQGASWLVGVNSVASGARLGPRGAGADAQEQVGAQELGTKLVPGALGRGPS